MSLNPLIKINGVEITEHNRKFTRLNGYENYDFELASGYTRRFYKEVDGIFTFSWVYVPDKASATIDGRAGRDYLSSLVHSGSNAFLEIKESHDDQFISYSCMISEYTENLLRHSLQTQCRYYDVSLSMESL
jgi:hypothetical protein